MHGGISYTSRHLAAPQDSCICGHIRASQTWGSREFLCTHSSMQGQETHEFPQVWLDSDREENTCGETWTVGHVKSRLAQSSQQRKLVASEVKDRHGSLGSFPHTFYLRASWHLYLLGTGMQNLCCFWTVLSCPQKEKHEAWSYSQSPWGCQK